MNFGLFRDGHPRTTLIFPSLTGPLRVEFIVDTGFEGDLALPGFLARQIDAVAAGFRDRVLASGTRIQCPVYKLFISWDDEPRLVEVIVLEGRPLLGTTFMQDYLFQVEITEGGEAALESL